MKKKRIITNNKEIYDKFMMLHFSPEIILKNVKKIQVDKLIRNINQYSVILSSEIIGNYILVKKIGPINFDIYLK